MKDIIAGFVIAGLIGLFGILLANQLCEDYESRAASNLITYKEVGR